MKKTITMFFYKIADKFDLKHSGSASRMIHDAKLGGYTRFAIWHFRHRLLNCYPLLATLTPNV